MAKRVINIELSTKSIEEAIREIREYQQNFKVKLNVFLERLGSLGIQVIDNNMPTGEDDPSPEHYAYMKVNSYDGYAEGTLYLQGEDILFIEFGAGIAFSAIQHPKASEMGYGVGTYPGQTHAYDEEGWWYTAEDGTRRHSRGNFAHMPLYKAETEIISSIQTIAREVFGS